MHPSGVRDKAFQTVNIIKKPKMLCYAAIHAVSCRSPANLRSFNNPVLKFDQLLCPDRMTADGKDPDEIASRGPRLRVDAYG